MSDEEIKEKTIEYENLKHLATIGGGSFGIVKLVEDIKTNSLFALKIVKKLDVIRLKQGEHIYSEKNTLYMLNSPFIVKLYQTFNDKESSKFFSK
jgi:cGMP-dependent protein kinase 1